MNKNTLIVYYSWSGNTEIIAKLIQEEIGGDLFELTPVQAYPSNYTACVEQAKGEIHAKAIHARFVPKLKALPDSLDNYDNIFIGTPIWWHTMSSPILTFLSNFDLSGKTIIPFSTHGGGGRGHYIEDIRKLCQDSNILDDILLFGNGGRNAKKDISTWLNRIEILV